MYLPGESTIQVSITLDKRGDNTTNDNSNGNRDNNHNNENDEKFRFPAKIPILFQFESMAFGNPDNP